MAQPIFNIPDGTESHDSFETASLVSITVPHGHQRGLGRTQNRFDTWLGRGLERWLAKLRLNGPISTHPQPSTSIPHPGAGDSPMELESVPLTRMATAVSDTVAHQPGIGRMLNRFDTWLGGKVENVIGRTVAVFVPTPEALIRCIEAELDAQVAVIAFEELKAKWKLDLNTRRPPFSAIFGFSSSEREMFLHSGWTDLSHSDQSALSGIAALQNYRTRCRYRAALRVSSGVKKQCRALVKHCRTKQPARLRSALQGIDTLAFKYTALKDIFNEQPEWKRMHHFVAPSQFCRAHEATALNTLASKALICVGEVELNTIGARLLQKLIAEEGNNSKPPGFQKFGKSEQQTLPSWEDWHHMLLYLKDPRFAFLAMRYWREFIGEELNEVDGRPLLLAPILEAALRLPYEAVEWSVIDDLGAQNVLEIWFNTKFLTEIVLQNPNRLPVLFQRQMFWILCDIIGAIEWLDRSSPTIAHTFMPGEFEDCCAILKQFMADAAELEVSWKGLPSQHIGFPNGNFLLAATLHLLSSPFLSILGPIAACLEEIEDCFPVEDIYVQFSSLLDEARALPAEDLPYLPRFSSEGSLHYGDCIKYAHITPSCVVDGLLELYQDRLTDYYSFVDHGEVQVDTFEYEDDDFDDDNSDYSYDDEDEDEDEDEEEGKGKGKGKGEVRGRC